MSTTYANLPAVELPGRWDHRIVLVENDDDGEGNIHSVLHTEVTADSAEQAEARSLAVLDYDYEDDLRGAVAEAVQARSNSRWAVTITLAGHR